MKRNEAEVFLGKDELYQQLTDTKLRIALLVQQEKETAGFLENDTMADDQQAQEAHFFAESEGRTIAKIHAQLRKQSLKHFARHDLPKIGQVAAAVLLVFYLGLTTAVATVQSVRVSLMKLLYNVEEQYTEISFQPDEDAAFDVPAEWDGDYFMAYIPDGYSFAGCTSNSVMQQEVAYIDAEGRSIRFCEMALQVESNIDTEGFSVKPVQINGASGLIATSASEATVIWATTDRYFLLRANCTKEEAIQIAEKVVRIK